MGVSLTWRPLNPNSGTSFAAGSTLHGYLKSGFGDYPIVFTEKDIPKLEGIIACGYDDLWDLIEAIRMHEKVEVRDHW